MADTRIELDRICAFREQIETSGLEIDMILHAYDGLSQLLLNVLQEVRELKEATGNA